MNVIAYDANSPCRSPSLIFTFPQFMYSTADSLKKKYTWSESSMELTKSGAEKRHSYSTDRESERAGGRAKKAETNEDMKQRPPL